MLRKKTSLLLLIFLIFLFPRSTLAAPPADELLAEGRVDDAIASLQGKITATRNDAESYNLLCRAYYEIGNPDPGVSPCEKAVSLNPDNSDYHLWLGRIYGEKAEHASFWSGAILARKVRSEFETAVRLNPNSVAARTDLAEFYLEAPGILGGGRDKAEAQAQVLLTLDPVKAHWVRGRLAEKTKNFAVAESEYRAAVQATNGRADAWLNLAIFYKHTKRMDAMEDAIRHASAGSQQNVMMDAAQALIGTGRNLPAATEILHRYLSGTTVEEAPAFKAHYLLGVVLERQGDNLGAAQEYRAALSLAKDFSPARTALGHLNNQVADNWH